ncbi:hypothetical protein EGR_02399 [Echinococcus granulosus]|uniref:Uncharacterized protein n=1 Tax=Echinococcus granulosus TaxID=6210 RepID=W6UN90_ECHGR|nr:hypothetical protein EGR_02399 [Echinococcus granulosus]EUB62603.1 hypothetical protein EGR_02399 [Echinococcus granulosus]
MWNEYIQGILEWNFKFANARKENVFYIHSQNPSFGYLLDKKLKQYLSHLKVHYVFFFYLPYVDLSPDVHFWLNGLMDSIFLCLGDVRNSYMSWYIHIDFLKPYL